MFMEHILEIFQKSRFLYADGAGYYYYEVLCFDQDIFKFIPNKISVSKDGIFLSYTYKYE